MKTEGLLDFLKFIFNIFITELSLCQHLDTLPYLVIRRGGSICNFGDVCVLLSLNYGPSPPPSTPIFWRIQTSPVNYYPLFTFNFYEIYISERKTINP